MILWPFGWSFPCPPVIMCQRSKDITRRPLTVPYLNPFTIVSKIKNVSIFKVIFTSKIIPCANETMEPNSVVVARDTQIQFPLSGFGSASRQSHQTASPSSTTSNNPQIQFLYDYYERVN